MLGVDVNGNTLTTMSTQLQPDSYVMMGLAQVNTNTHTNRLRLHVQVQLFQPAHNIGRRRLKGNGAFFF